MGFSKPGYWSGLPCPSPGDFSNPGIESWSPTLQVVPSPAEPPGKPQNTRVGCLSLFQWIFPPRNQTGSEVRVTKSCSTLRPHGLQPARLFCPWESPGKNAGVGSLSLLQGIFPNQGSNPGLLHCRQILYHLSHQGSPRVNIQPHVNHLRRKGLCAC